MTSSRTRRHCRKTGTILESDADYDPELWKNAAELGWLGAVIPEEFGGAGFGHLELVLIAEEVGRGLLPIPFSSSVYMATEAILQIGSDAQKKKYLGDLASGDRIGTLAIAEGMGHPGPQHIQARFEGGKLSGTKIAVPDGNVANLAVVVAKTAKGISLVLVDLTAAGVTKESVESIDPTRASANISFTDAPAELLGADGEGWELVQKVLNRAAILMAFEQLGGADRAFEITKEYMLGRYAYGRPVASFQALKHRMADMYVALQLARSNCYYGGLGSGERRRRDGPRRLQRPRQRHAGVRSVQRRDDPAARRRRVHLGVRLPHVLPPGQAPGRGARLPRPLARQADPTPHRQAGQQGRLRSLDDGL